MSDAKAPTHRPAWLTFMAAAMVLYGGLTLVSALLAFRQPSPEALPAVAAEGPAAAPDLGRELTVLNQSLLAAHRVAVRACALAALAVALFTLYTAAAIFSRDRHGRRLAISTGWIGIVYQLGTLPAGLAFARQAASEGALALAKGFIASGGARPGSDPQQVAAQMRTAIVAQPIVVAAIGVLWCVCVLVCFGGRRGRVVYGLELPTPRSGPA